MTALDTSSILDLGLDIRPLAAHIGAEMHGIDLSAELDDDVIAAVRTALLRWKVVFFRDQDLTPAHQVAFGRRFGEVTPAHPTLPALSGHPEVLALDSREYKAHLAPADLRGLHFDRVMHRITLAGDEPVGPSGFTSHPLQGDQFT